jgi:hypothetical protein
MALAGHQTTEKATGWRGLPFPPKLVLHARGLPHGRASDCPFCRLRWGECPSHRDR